MRINNKKDMYDKQLAKEWIEWVENDDLEGSREKEIYPIIRNWVKKVRPVNVETLLL